MNTKKHKSKKANRQVNVSCPQNDDNKITDSVADSQTPLIECEIKGESGKDIADDLPKQIDEQKMTEVITPKKPKRNKGKKKQDTCENEQDKLTNLVGVENLPITDSESVQKDCPVVIPVRKKKNKKKGNELECEKLQLLEQKQANTENVQENKTSCFIDKPIITLEKRMETVEEVKVTKKKNKIKKNRTDSEKSDKTVENVSCISAFQQIINDGDDTRSKEDFKQRDTELVTKNDYDSVDAEKVGKAIHSLKLDDINSSAEIGETEQETQNSEDLLGKKARSDNDKKKVQQSFKKTNLFLDKQKDCQKEQITMALKGKMPEDDTATILVKNNKVSSSEDDGLIYKANIAKPVNKKRKGKQIIPANEPDKATDCHVIGSPGTSVVESIEKTPIEIEVKKEIIADDSKLSENRTMITDSPMTSVKDNFDFEESKSKQESYIALDTIETINVVKQAPLQEVIQKSSGGNNQDVIKYELLFETLVPTDLTSNLSEDKLNEILNTVTQPTDGDELIKTDTKQVTEKPKTKRKKSPKIYITPEKSTISTEISKDTDNIKIHELSDKNTLRTASKIIKKTSIKPDELEGSSCEVIPDILYPRSTSEHSRDGNNNTIIQEIFEDNSDFLSPNIPIIQGSGGTPTETPEEISPGIKLVEIVNLSLKSEEKTDIKSKMMEVNKDMEELRLSIEKSLYGLNALDKDEKISVKPFEHEHNPKLKNKNILENQATISTPNIVSEENTKNITDSQDNATTDEVVVLEHSDNILRQHTTTNSNILTEYQDKEVTSSVNVNQSNIEESIDKDIKTAVTKSKIEQCKQDNIETNAPIDTTPPICPARRDHKKGKKRRGRQEVIQPTNEYQSQSTETSTREQQDTNKDKEKSQQKNETTEQKSNQQSNNHESGNTTVNDHRSNRETNASNETDYEPIDNFEDALTSSADDVNQSFEMIINQMTEDTQQELALNKPEINIIAPGEELQQKHVQENPVTPSKNLLGHPDIPVRSNKTDYKKEKNKSPDTKQAKVKIKDIIEIETNKDSKDSQMKKNKMEEKLVKLLKDEDHFCQISNCEEFTYRYSFRKVFLQSTCHVCKKELSRFQVPCKFCSLVFYCSVKHKDDDWSKHQALCFAVSTIGHIKGQKHIYADAKGITGHNYRVLRMQAILACEKVLKRRLVPREQEVLLYPRICADVSCREWRQSKLKDCEGCGQISYCSANADHMPKSHQRWCKSYSLYQKLVIHQQSKGRLEPKLPSRVLKENLIPDKMNEVLASMFEEKIDLDDIQYAALTQIATAPLTAAFCHQIYRSNKCTTQIINKMAATFIIHVVGAELQFEADVLNKWEIFFLHLRPDVKDLRIVLINPDLNPGKLPLDLLGRISLCENCRQSKRRVVFSFQDKKNYQEYRNGDDFIYPDIICAFNPSLHRSSVYNGNDPWPSTINAIMKLKTPFVITSHTITELQRDLTRLKELSELQVIVDPKSNPFSSVRPDRNFITDDEVPLLFKNHCFMILLGV